MEEEKIKEIVENSLQGSKDLFLVDVKLKGNVGNQKVLIFIDGDQGISIDQCSKISREVASVMEEEDFIKGKYTLEVSSPGLDFPLSMHRQYVKNVGRELTVETNEGDQIEAELITVNEELIELKKKGEEHFSLPFKEIKQSKVKVSFK